MTSVELAAASAGPVTRVNFHFLIGICYSGASKLAPSYPGSNCQAGLDADFSSRRELRTVSLFRGSLIQII